MLYVGPGSSEAMHHVNSKIIALVSRLHVFERFMNRNKSLYLEKSLFIENLEFNHCAIDELFQRLASIRSQYFRGSVPISENPILSRLSNLVEFPHFVDIPKVVFLLVAQTLLRVCFDLGDPIVWEALCEHFEARLSLSSEVSKHLSSLEEASGDGPTDQFFVVCYDCACSQCLFRRGLN